MRDLDEEQYRNVDLFEISLSSGRFCYALWLDPLLMFLDSNQDTSLEKNNIEKISRSPILFKIGVDISWRRRWRRVGKVSVPAKYFEPVDFARHDISTGKMTIYTRIPGSMKFPPDKVKYMERPARIEECRSLEPLISWSPKAVEDRLELHFKGEESPILKWFWGKVR